MLATSTTKYPYLKQNRLSDVIRLIAALAIVEEASFRTTKGINESVRGEPNSAENWIDVAADHPEFFRLNKEKSNVILLMRFLLQPSTNEGEKRKPLSIDQAQKMIDQAIVLHDKQLANYQKNNFRIPVIVAIIAAFVSAGTAFYNANYNATNNDLKKVSTKIDSLTAKIEKLQNLIPKKP